MDTNRFSEEDFDSFIGELINGNRFSDAKEAGIAQLVIDKGFESLSDKQKFVFEKSISYFIEGECKRCGQEVPWSEMLMTEFNGGLCSWCQQLSRDDND